MCHFSEYFKCLFQEIPISPFKVKVDPSHDAGKVRAEGPGLNKTGESFDAIITITVHLKLSTNTARVFQAWRWALQPISPFIRRELERPSLRCILQHQAPERLFVTLRSSIITITPTLSSTQLCNR